MSTSRWPTSRGSAQPVNAGPRGRCSAGKCRGGRAYLPLERSFARNCDRPEVSTAQARPDESGGSRPERFRAKDPRVVTLVMTAQLARIRVLGISAPRRMAQHATRHSFVRVEQSGHRHDFPLVATLILGRTVLPVPGPRGLDRPGSCLAVPRPHCRIHPSPPVSPTAMALRRGDHSECDWFHSIGRTVVMHRAIGHTFGRNLEAFVSEWATLSSCGRCVERPAADGTNATVGPARHDDTRHHRTKGPP